MPISIKNFIHMCLETSLRGIYYDPEFIKIKLEKGVQSSLNQNITAETNNKSDGLESETSESEAENKLWRSIISGGFQEPKRPPNYHLLSAFETKFYSKISSEYWFNYVYEVLAPAYNVKPTHRRFLFETLNNRDIRTKWTLFAAIKYVCNFSWYDIPVVNFIKVCYQALSKIDSAQEEALVNLIIEILKDRLVLEVQKKRLTKMTELTMLIKQKFFPSIDPFDCMLRMSQMQFTKEECVVNYVARFQQLHTIILDHEVNVNPDIDILEIIQQTESKHLSYFLNGIPRDLARQLLDVYPFIHEDLNCFLREFILICQFNDTSTFPLNPMKEEKPLQLNAIFEFSRAIPTKKIRNVKLGIYTNNIGMLKAKEIGVIIPYFDGDSPKVYEFAEIVYIALSNILVDEEEELIGIILSRLKGKAAEHVKWVIITSVIHLLNLLLYKFDSNVYTNIDGLIASFSMLPMDSIYDYIRRFKRLHGMLIHKKVISNKHIPIKEVIHFEQTRNLMIFIEGLARTSYLPNFQCYGFYDFFDKVIDHYNMFHKSGKK